MLNHLYKKRKTIKSVHSIIKTQTVISSSSNNTTLSKDEFKAKLKNRISSQAYDDLESYWKSIGLDEK